MIKYYLFFAIITAEVPNTLFFSKHFSIPSIKVSKKFAIKLNFRISDLLVLLTKNFLFSKTNGNIGANMYLACSISRFVEFTSSSSSLIRYLFYALGIRHDYSINI